jgi:hypothetical protein
MFVIQADLAFARVFGKMGKMGELKSLIETEKMWKRS